MRKISFQKNGKINPLKLALIIVVFLSLVFILVKKFDLPVKQINVSPNILSCTDSGQIKQLISKKNNGWLFFDTKQVKDNIVQKFLCIGDVKIDKQFPSSININLSERTPVFKVQLLSATESTPSSQEAKLKISEGTISAKLLADQTGLLFSNNVDLFPNLPTISVVNAPLTLGGNIKFETQKALLAILNKLNELAIAYNNLWVVEDHLIVDANEQIIFSLSKDIGYQLASLQLIVNEAKMRQRLMDKIDLRFDKPVVVYSPKK